MRSRRAWSSVSQGMGPWGMDEQAEADAWVRRQLDVTREIFRTHPPGPRDLTLEQYEQQLRQKADVCLRPTESYVGLDLEAAEGLPTSRAIGCAFTGDRRRTGRTGPRIASMSTSTRRRRFRPRGGTPPLGVGDDRCRSATYRSRNDYRRDPHSLASAPVSAADCVTGDRVAGRRACQSRSLRPSCEATKPRRS